MSEPMKIYDGSPAARQARKQAKTWNGFHLLLTRQTQSQLVLRTLWLPVLIVYLVCFVILAQWQDLSTPACLLISLLPAALGYVGFQDEVFKKFFNPGRDCGRLDLPAGMTWEQAVERIRYGFTDPYIERIASTDSTLTFCSQKRGTYQLQYTNEGLKMVILSKPSQRAKKAYLYNVYCNALLSQVIALLYPDRISAAQTAEERTQVEKLFKAYHLPMILEIVITVVFIAVMGTMFYLSTNSASARSLGISDSELNAFPDGATVGQVLDAFFVNGKWDNYKQDGVSFVSYSGEGVNKQTDEKVVIAIYFRCGDDDTFEIDHMTWNGENLGTFDMLSVLSVLNDNYIETVDQSSSNPLSDTIDALDALSELENLFDFDDTSDSISASSNTGNEAESLPAASSEAQAPAVRQGTAPAHDKELSESISVDLSSYLDGSDAANSDLREYYRGYGEQAFFNAWQDAVYSDLYRMEGTDGYLSAWKRFRAYMSFYWFVFDDSEGLAADYGDIYTMPSLDPTTDDEAMPYVENVIELAMYKDAEYVWDY